MQVKEKKIDDLNMKLTVKLDKADWDEPKKKKLNNFRHQADIKGFRKGMAPMSLIERLYGGQAMAEVINGLVSDAINTHIEDKKLEIIEKLKAVAEETGDGLAEKVQKLVEEYNAIGHVPFKEKDKLYKEYHAVLDKLYKDLNISTAKRKLSNFKQNLKQVAERGENALDNERARLFRQYEALKQEIQTYENNLGFLNASSKKGNSLIDEMNRKVQKLKDDMNLVREKIKAIDAENK